MIYLNQSCGGVIITFESILNYSQSNASKKKKIGIFIGEKTDEYHVSAYIRILSPLNELTDYYNIEIIDEDTFKLFFEDLDSEKCDLDIIVFQRNNFGTLGVDLKFITDLFEKIKKKQYQNCL